MKPRGYVLWRGASLLDGAPIVAIAITHRSANTKTGNMVQTYILRSDVAPLDALRTGDDTSVCGDCVHRPYLGGGCYVQVGRGPRTVYREFKAHKYPGAEDIPSLARGRMVRLGSYGDPAAVPAYVWESLVSSALGHTGYTHQWRNPSLHAEHRARITALCMASADSIGDAVSATLQGLRYFRVHADPSAKPGPREFICPASSEANRVRTCATCKACHGSAHRGASPIILAHGPTATRFTARQLF